LLAGARLSGPAQLRLDDENLNAFMRLKYFACLRNISAITPRPDQAERYLSKGLEVAREQKAKSLESKLA
jgi:hypothetical protein